MKARTLPARLLAFCLAFLIVAPESLPGQSSPQLPDPGSTHVNRQQQEQLGLQTAAEVYKQMPVLPDSSPVTRYVQQLGRKLVGVIPQQYSWPYQFHVVQEKEINAFALPGGPIFINIGTIQAADNEAELAGVMSHEMSHVYMQHSAKAMPKQEFAGILAGIVGAVMPGTAAGNLARLGIQVGAGTVLMKYSRKDEAQADAVGAIIMYKAGYNPHALADFFQKLESQGGSGGPQFLSDHPNPGNREQAISNEVRNWPSRNYLGSSQEFASARQDATRVKAYTAQEIATGAKQGLWQRYNQQSGAVPGNVPVSSNGGNDGTAPSGGQMQDVSFRQVQPSSRFTSTQQDGFTISYPENWRANPANGGVTIAPEAGVSGESVAYGVIIGEAQNTNGQSLDEATQNLAQGLQQSNPGLRASGSPSSIDVNGVQGRSVSMDGISPLKKGDESLAERDWLVAVPRPQGGLLYLVFVAPERDFNQLRPTYQKILDSLQVR